MVGIAVGGNVGGGVPAVVGNAVGSWALDVARRRSRAAVLISELMMVMFEC